MFNMFNARNIRDEYNVFEGLFQSHIFFSIWFLIIIFQARHLAAIESLPDAGTPGCTAAPCCFLQLPACLLCLSCRALSR